MGESTASLFLSVQLQCPDHKIPSFRVKLEARNPKFEANSNDKNTRFEFLSFVLWICFVLRISCFEFKSVRYLRGHFLPIHRPTRKRLRERMLSTTGYHLGIITR